MAQQEETHVADSVCEINVTPMIDILLCLIIIFMVSAAPPPTHKQAIALPENVPIEQPSDKDATLLVTIEDDGKMTLGTTPLAPEHDAMVEQFKASEKAQSQGRIAIKAGDAVPYGRVIGVMSAAHEANIGSVGIASERL